jgi:tight adherence protein B
MYEVLLVFTVSFPFLFVGWWINRGFQKEKAYELARMLRRMGISQDESAMAVIESARREAKRMPLVKYIDKITSQAGYTPEQTRRSVMFTLFFLFIDLLIVMSGVIDYQLGLVLLMIGFPLAPISMIVIKVVQRQKKLSQQFPDVLEAIVRTLYAGATVDVAMKMVEEDFPEPIAEEFGILNRHLSLGIPMREALREFQMRLRIPEVQYFVITLIIQRETGGRLADILGQLAGIIRRRVVFVQKMKVLTAETRFTSIFVGGVPLFYLLYKYFYDEESMRFFMNDPTGWTMFQVSVGMIIVGMLSIKFLMKTKF